MAFRVSQINAFSQCEVMALSAPPRPPGRTNIAAFVGTLAHGLISGIPVEEPQRLAFDPITNSLREAKIQAREIATEARRLLFDAGWAVIGTEEYMEQRNPELTGHLDIRAYHSDHGEAIADLKSGAQIGAAWLQTGGYIYMNDQDVLGGVLHVPRVPTNKDTKGTLEFRDGTALADAWETFMARHSAIMDGAKPTYSPGMHCGRCTLECPVRIGKKP